MKKRRDGFTLIEVIVALVILSVMAAGFMGYTGQRAQRAAYLADKALAVIVASNAITEMQTTGQWPDTGERTQRVGMAGKDWQVSLQVQETALPDLRRLGVSVTPLAAAQDQASPSLVTLTGFAGKH